jgi:S-DNA-T family DNA segregation ATPase FtsK/SpoIIIE
MIALLTAMLFVFLSEFGIMGPVGNAIRDVVFGLFGFSSYILPFFVFLASAYYFIHRDDEDTQTRIFCSVILFICFGIICELIAGGTAAEKYSITEIWTRCSQGRSGGGVLFGTPAYFLCLYLKEVGLILVLIAVILLCTVVISGHSLADLLTNREDYDSDRPDDDDGPAAEPEDGHEEPDRPVRQDRYDRQDRPDRSEMQQRREYERARREEEIRRRRERDRELEEQLCEEKENESILKRSNDFKCTLEKTELTGTPLDADAAAKSKHVEEAAAGAGTNSIARVDFSADSADTPQAPQDMDDTRTISPETADAAAAPLKPSYSTDDDLHEINADNADYDEMTVMKDLEEEPAIPAAPYSGIGVPAPQDRNPDYTSEQFSEKIYRQSMQGTIPVIVDTDISSAASGAAADAAAPAFGTASAATAATFGSSAARPKAVHASGIAAMDLSENTETAPAGSNPADTADIPVPAPASRPAADVLKTAEDVPAAVPVPVPTVKKPAPAAEDIASIAVERERIEGKAGGQNEAGSAPDRIADPLHSSQKKPSVFPKPAVRHPYQAPPLTLLQPGEKKKDSGSDRELQETAYRLQNTLKTFGVDVTIPQVSQGPSVTRYELLPAQGVKVSRIVSLADDIKLNLAAADIRIEAPIPGKAAIGIEVPNKVIQTVSLRDLFESENYRDFKGRIAFAVGKDIGGNVIVSDITKMPHMLIAGSTGSGKSVCINTLIMSILFRYDPENVKMIMIDPKVVELSVYNGIPHLLLPVVTDPKKASGALQWAVTEMTDRYRKFADSHVRDLKGYNEKAKSDPDPDMEVMPQIVIIVDELADLMMVSANEVEQSICRLAQLARAAGIHLIIATQRPSVDVITGLIKANMPSRLAFAVSSGVDSRTILDMNGAEKLLGKGDMLFYPQGYAKPARIQGAFVSDKEVEDVVKYIRAHNPVDDSRNDIEKKIESMSADSSGAGGSGSSGGDEGPDIDEHFVEAGYFIIDKDKASIGNLQRVFKIGFNRAARIMDQLCDAGVVSAEEGTKPRKVLMSRSDFESYIEENGL